MMTLNSIDPSTAMLNCFYEIAAARGRRRFLLLCRNTVSNHPLVMDEHPIRHSSDFLQYYVRGSEQSVVGSVLDIRTRFCVFTGLAVAYSPPTDQAQFTCPTESSSGGLLIYLNGLGKFMAVSARVNPNPLLVTDRGEHDG